MVHTTSQTKGDFTALVTHNSQIGPSYFRLGLQLKEQAAKVYAHFQAGQFVELKLDNAALPAQEAIPPDLADLAQRHIILRRPFSLCSLDVQATSTSLEIIYGVIGPGTVRMTNLQPGQSVALLGPLGNGFSIPENKRRALLVAGGVGAPPIQHLATSMAASGTWDEIVLFTGARTVEDLPFVREFHGDQLILPELAACQVKVCIATDDGSYGHHGFVTDCLTEHAQGQSPSVREETMVYACGPEPMLAKVASIAESLQLDCQVSMEQRMACGINLCQGCAIECSVPGSTETVYRMCCEDGPVFDAREVIFN
jgi:dihydroorotate dehydrogenase electron transfer subunit